MQRLLNALFIWTLSFILLGALSIQILGNERPCPLCLLQRLAMLGVAFGALLNLRYYISTTHYGLMLLSSVFGAFVALRHIGLHLPPEEPEMGIIFFGLSLFTWSFIVFACSIAATAILLFLYNPPKAEEEKNDYILLSEGAFWVVLAIVLMNILVIYIQCGLGPCV